MCCSSSHMYSLDDSDIMPGSQTEMPRGGHAGPERRAGTKKSSAKTDTQQLFVGFHGRGTGDGGCSWQNKTSPPYPQEPVSLAHWDSRSARSCFWRSQKDSILCEIFQVLNISNIQFFKNLTFLAIQNMCFRWVRPEGHWFARGILRNSQHLNGVKSFSIGSNQLCRVEGGDTCIQHLLSTTEDRHWGRV